jgi:hypothetical protein
VIKNIFDTQVCDEVITRINSLESSAKPIWGKMDAAKMMAHCNVTYEQVFENIHSKPPAILKFILKLMVKGTVVNDKPYKKNSSTAPAFIIKSDKDFEAEKSRLTNYIQKTLKLGSDHFEGKESLSFGPLTSKEWNNLFYKHLDHHLRQFGV